MKINKQNSPLFNQGKAKWEAFVATYNGPYDFSNSVYAGMNQKVAFLCPTHGAVTSDAKNMINGASCNKCALEARVGRNRLTKKKMLAKFFEKHGKLYDYSLCEYKGQETPVAIKCSTHGVFMQRPEDHWRGSGCPQCFHENRRGATQRDTTESFIKKVQAIHGNSFDLSSVVYANSQQDIEVVCIKHNKVCKTKPNWLLNGCNPCTSCNHMKSKQEQSLADYLKIFTSIVQHDRQILKPKELDIYAPSVALAIEYSGMFWHSHGSVEEELKNKNNHQHKYAQCAAKGIRLITIYETEWLERQQAIKRLLRNAVGKAKGKLMARKCELKKTTHQEAVAFYERYHPQGGAGNGEYYGLYWKGKLVACMRFTYGINDRGIASSNRVWTLSRYATRVNVVGGASKLFKAFIDEHNPSEVKSFSDNRYFSGGMYQQLGFSLDAEIQPDYQIWSMKGGLKTKAQYQRRCIQARLTEHGVEETFDPENDTRSERDMTYLMGARRIYDCGKKRWVWKSK